MHIAEIKMGCRGCGTLDFITRFICFRLCRLQASVSAGSRFQAPGSRFQAPGSRLQSPGLRLLAPGWASDPATMRSLLDSSWDKYGPAGRDSLDWSPGPSGQPSSDGQAPDQSSGEAMSAGSITYIVIATVTFFLVFFSVLGFLFKRRRHVFGLNSKLGLANVINLEDLEDPERNCELLSSIRRSRGQQLPSSSSEQDVNDGVFLMVYLPSPYEQTLTRIARAASTKRPKDPELMPPSPGPETGSRGAEEEGTRLEDKATVEEDMKAESSSAGIL
ncbi:uncharacterized protein LOC134859194 [Eleginops maclovinus]